MPKHISKKSNNLNTSSEHVEAVNMSNQDDELELRKVLNDVVQYGGEDMAFDPEVANAVVSNAMLAINTLFEQRLLKIMPEKKTKSSEGYPNAEKLEAWKDGFNKCRSTIMENFRKDKE